MCILLLLLFRFDVALRLTREEILIPSHLPKNRPGQIVLPSSPPKSQSYSSLFFSTFFPSLALAEIVRRYSMCFIPPGFWPRLVTRLLSFPRRAVKVPEPKDQKYWACGLYSYWTRVRTKLIRRVRAYLVWPAGGILLDWAVRHKTEYTRHYSSSITTGNTVREWVCVCIEIFNCDFLQPSLFSCWQCWGADWWMVSRATQCIHYTRRCSSKALCHLPYVYWSALSTSISFFLLFLSFL